MREISLEEQKDILKRMLQNFHDFCEKNHLIYYLTGGTLLGAVRHHGFIPWDDDIDVCMPRNDYEKLLDSFNGSIEGLSIISVRNREEGYYLPFAKIINTGTLLRENMDTDYEMGIYLDIFPIDNLSNDYNTAYKLYKKVTRYRNILSIKNIKIAQRRVWYKNLTLKIGKAISAIMPREKVLERIDIMSQRYRGNNRTTYIGMVCAAFYGKREILKSEWFKNRCLVEFEGMKVWAPENYDAFLGQLYGDYMQLPPVEKRVTHHEVTAWKL